MNNINNEYRIIYRIGNYNIDLNQKEFLTIIFLVTTGGQLTVKVNLNHIGARVQIFGLIKLSNKDKLTINTSQNHNCESTKSNLLFKSVLDGESKLEFHGKIFVSPDARKTDAYQRNDNILLSPRAYAISSPVLEILTNDIKCSHAATISPLSEDEFFYLQSRGLSRRVAQNLLVSGFLRSISEKIDNQDIQDLIAKRFESKL